MSWWKARNPKWRDEAQSKTPDGEILNALLGSMTAAAAQRVLSALSQMYVTKAELRKLLGAQHPPKPPVTSEERAAKTEFDKKKAEQKNKAGAPPDLDVAGWVAFQNNALVGGAVLANNVFVNQNIQAGGLVAARQGAFQQLAVGNALNVNQAACNLGVPLVAGRPIVAQQGGVFARDNAFNGTVHLNGGVIWNNRACNPATVSMAAEILADDSDKVTVGFREAMVLKDHGPGQQQQFQVSVENTTVPITVVTAVGFDATSCAITSATTTVYFAGATGAVKISRV